MSASSNEISERRRLSNVTFSSISSDVLLVRIRKMSGEVKEEDVSKMSTAFKPVPEKPGEKERIIHSKFTMTDSKKTSSISSQTFRDEQAASTSTADPTCDSTPCLKHAAENISRKASNIPSEKIDLCNNCSKSMLSYIFLVQDFLDSLAKEIVGNESSHCLQCARQEVRNNLAASHVKEGDSPIVEPISRRRPEHKLSSHRKKDIYDASSSNKMSGAKTRQDPKTEEYYQRIANPTSQRHVYQQEQTEFIYQVTPTNAAQDNVQARNLSGRTEKRIIIKQQSSDNKTSPENANPYRGSSSSFDEKRTHPDGSIITSSISSNDQALYDSHKEVSTGKVESASQSYVSSSIQDSPTVLQQTKEQSEDKRIFRSPLERQQPNYQTHFPVGQNDPGDNDPDNNVLVKSPNLYSEGVDGIVSTLSNTEREIYDSARNGAGWESLTESQERLGIPPGNVITSEAFVTSCRNNAEAIGCLVVGTSLLLCRTSRTLCVLVSDGVSTAFRTALSTVFQVVQYVRSLDSLGTTKLALLEQPELGITFEKLNIWRLVQFSKCVYLNPDTLVIQNCDELFNHEELSAVPDIGWPDCFNSGVFVYSPSVHTFWQLLEFAEKQGSYDGGDQGLLNSYFNSWSTDISKKLSFIYNLMANVSYTYSPAFRQFGRDVKIVQFHGSFKPWHVKFFSKTGQISPSSPVHPTYVQFVHIWINIFRITVLRLLSEAIQSYAASQETISAVETLRFFPLPTESEAEFFLTPPSVRMRLAEKKLARSVSQPLSEARRRKSAEFFRHERSEEDIPEINKPRQEEIDIRTAEESESSRTEADRPKPDGKLDESPSEMDVVFKEAKAEEKEKVKDENVLPGSEVGDYQGMKAWEQGRMDYEGTDRSDNVIKRLQFLMSSKNN